MIQGFWQQQNPSGRSAILRRVGPDLPREKRFMADLEAGFHRRGLRVNVPPLQVSQEKQKDRKQNRYYRTSITRHSPLTDLLSSG